MKQSSNDWVTMIDIDRRFKKPQYALNAIRNRKLYEKARYLFVVHAPNWGQGVHPSVNDYLIHKDHFFSAGGYDEEIVGQRWGDREYFRQLMSASGKEIIMHDIDLRHTRKSTQFLDSKTELLSSSNPVSFVELIESRIQKPDRSKPILGFEWEQIT